LAQIVAEELGMPVDAVGFQPIDTLSTPDDPWGSVASRGTFVVGSAVRQAAITAGRLLLEAAATALGVRSDSLVIDGDRVATRNGRRSISIDDLVAKNAIVATGTVVSERTPPTFGAYFAEVEVDPDTGAFRVERLVAAIDVGFAVNPAQCRGQVEGAIAHGVEFALGAEVVLRNGEPENTTLVDYRVARTTDMPRIEVILVEGADETGPYGARGIGTPALAPVLPAIANAVRDAIGSRITHVPMWPEHVQHRIASLSPDP
jgi:CO/xanthine dehydrogenase Mo-binding subunit